MRNHVRFLLGDEVHTLDAVDPNLTVLRYLREHCARMGTKEGCAEGDCGACTVAIGERDGAGEIRYYSANACIQFVATLDGKQVLTVEDLGSANDDLHPVQQAMVDHHGSQCGFCTPGFVMSLFVLNQRPTPPDRLQIQDALAGNLCRCTGYGPIVAAAAASLGQSTADFRGSRASEIAARLEAWNDGESVEISGPAGRYLAPGTLDQAVSWLAAHPQATLLAGGTDVGLWVTKQHRRLDPLIYLGNVRELHEVDVNAKRYRIGAGVSVNRAMEILGSDFPDLGELLRRYGADQVRNLGTLGGNVANGSPIGDSPPPLMALGATLELAGPEGRRRMPLEAFFLDYGRQDRRADEIVSAIEIPLPRPGEQFACYKVSKRFDQDISAVCAAFKLRLDEDGHVIEFRSGFGGVAAIPRRSPALEDSLVGLAWTRTTLDRGLAALVQDFTPIDDMRASAEYRLRIVGRLLEKFYIETTQPKAKTRLFGTTEHALGTR